jgi:hypothetical protein
MAVTEQVSRPAPFVEKLGTNLAENVLAQQGVPIVTGGLGSISQGAAESAEAFKARQDAAQAFDVRKQSLAGLAPQVAGQDALQGTAQDIAKAAAGVGTAQEGLGSFQPFLQRAQEAGAASTGLLGNINAQNLLGTGVNTAQAGDPASLGSIESYMSPYQSQVIDASLAEFDRNTKIQQQQIRDQQAALGALGSGRAGVQLAEYGTGAARERALLQAGLLQQGFGQAQAARQQDIANRGSLASQQQSLGQFQTALGQTEQGILGTNVSRLGQLGALNQAQTQAEYDATREATRQAAFQPQEQLDRYAAQVTGIMGGYPGQTVSTNVPNPTPLQTALGVGTTLAGIYGGLKNPGKVNYNLGVSN